MSAKYGDDKKAEAYARALFEAAGRGGRISSDLVQWKEVCKLSPEILELLGTMHEQGDIGLINEIAAHYEEFVKADGDMVSVQVTTAVPLDDKLRAKIKDKAEADFGKPVYLTEKVEPDILGGIILEVEGKHYDASIRSQLANIRETLASTFNGGDKDE
jgi:F-type H+-transporting ATPase subunit delta